jgi:hypothetical protein
VLVEKSGRVSIWLNRDFKERNRSIGWFDHDTLECTGSDQPVPLRRICSGFSYVESWIDAAEAAANAPGVPEITYVWMLFGYEYQGTPGPIAGGKDAYFLGTFDYHR